MTRRWSGDWAGPPGSGSAAEVDVLIPTRNRPAELAVTLAGLAAQDGPDFAVVISDQSTDVPSWNHPAAEAMVRVLEAQGRPVRLLRHLPARGLAEQRHFLLGQSGAPQVLFLDDDVWLEPDMLARLTAALASSGGGFVGAAVQGLSYLADRRPEEQQPFEVWENGQVQPERIRRSQPGFSRWTLHNAANLAHVASGLGIPPGEWRLYRIAWVGACVLYDRQALLECGGFGFWDQLPPGHAGEDVAAQWRVMERFGGAGMVPSGAVHLESPTTVTDRSADAAELILGTAEYNPSISNHKGERMAEKPSPIDVQKTLGGLDYPASKEDIVKKAEGAGAEGTVLEALKNLPERQYDAPTDISKEIFD